MSGTSDFLGSWINGNLRCLLSLRLDPTKASDFLGSWINGNSQPNRILMVGTCLLTSSEVELMETAKAASPYETKITASDFLGSWINGNKNLLRIRHSSKTSDFLGSWINGNFHRTGHGLCQLKYTSDFLGSWINGNHSGKCPSKQNGYSYPSDFLGSWINGNRRLTSRRASRL